MNNLRTAILRTGTLSAIAGLVLTGAAMADVTPTQTYDIGFQPTELAQTFTFTPFDSLGGTRTLDSAVVSLSATGQFTGSVKNTAAQAQNFTLTENSNVTFTGPSSLSLLGTLTGTQTYTALPSGTTAPFAPVVAPLGPISSTITGAGLSAFTGPGAVGPFNISTLTGVTQLGGGGNVTTVFTTAVDAKASIFYNYHTTTTNPTPEPGAWASMSIGVLGLMALGLKARKKNLQF